MTTRAQQHCHDQHLHSPDRADPRFAQKPPRQGDERPLIAVSRRDRAADVFRRFADGYLSAHGTAMPASHRRAIADILACRTEALGGHLWRCDRCSHEVFSYHSCKNRSCPKCHTKQAKDWLDARKAEILPTDYFHVTITVPQELRALLRANQRDGYALLMKAAADAIIELAHDRRFVGGTIGVLAVPPHLDPAARLPSSRSLPRHRRWNLR